MTTSMTMETILMKAGRATYPWYVKYPGFVFWVSTTWYIQHKLVDSHWHLLWSIPVGFLVGALTSGLWWLDNDEDYDKGFVFRYLRNSAMNFKRYVVGVADRDHWITGKVPAWVPIRSDLINDPQRTPETELTGWQYAFTHVFGIPLLPWVSYAGTHVEWYAGWQPWGELAFKWNLLNSKAQLW